MSTAFMLCLTVNTVVATQVSSPVRPEGRVREGYGHAALSCVKGGTCA